MTDGDGDGNDGDELGDEDRTQKNGERVKDGDVAQAGASTAL